MCLWLPSKGNIDLLSLTARVAVLLLLQVKQLVHVAGSVVAGADALLVFGGQGVEQPDLLTLLPLPGAQGEVGPRLSAFNALLISTVVVRNDRACTEWWLLSAMLARSCGWTSFCSFCSSIVCVTAPLSLCRHELQRLRLLCGP